MMRETSASVYERIVCEGLLSKRRLQVYQVLYEHGPLTGGQLSEIVKNKFGEWGQSETVRNRLPELRNSGVVKECGTIKCPTSGNEVILWDVTDKYPTDPPKKVATRDVTEALCQLIEEPLRVMKEKPDVGARWSVWIKKAEFALRVAEPRRKRSA